MFDPGFKQESSLIYAKEGDEALSAKDNDKAIDLYSAVIDLDCATDIIFANRCRAKLNKEDWKEALLDANKVGWHLSIRTLCSCS
jgi:hypothetical protein